jgi:hypothetical protein
MKKNLISLHFFLPGSKRASHPTMTIKSNVQKLLAILLMAIVAMATSIGAARAEISQRDQ